MGVPRKGEGFAEARNKGTACSVPLFRKLLWHSWRKQRDLCSHISQATKGLYAVNRRKKVEIERIRRGGVSFTLENQKNPQNVYSSLEVLFIFAGKWDEV